MTAKTNTAGTPLPTQCHFSAKAHQGACHVARFDSHGRYILTGGADRAVRLWNASAARSEEGPTAIKTYSSGHSHEILAIDIASDNARFASGGGDKSVMLWDVTTSQILRRFSAHEGRINDIRFAGPTTSEQSSHGGSSSSATLLCTAGFDGVLRFYDLRAQGAWRPVMECKDARDAILCTCIQGHNVWTGSTDGVVRRYDVRAGALTEDTVDEPIVSLDASSSCSLLLVSTTDSRHRLFDTVDGSLLQTFSGHTNESYRCHAVLSPMEDLVFGGDETGSIKAWDVMTAKSKPIAASLHHQRAILWTECNPKSVGEIVTASSDGFVKIWRSA